MHFCMDLFVDFFGTDVRLHGFVLTVSSRQNDQIKFMQHKYLTNSRHDSEMCDAVEKSCKNPWRNPPRSRQDKCRMGTLAHSWLVMVVAFY